MTLRKRLAIRLIKTAIKVLQADWRKRPSFDYHRSIGKLIDLKDELEGK
jgi:hypothetical protein